MEKGSRSGVGIDAEEEGTRNVPPSPGSRCDSSTTDKDSPFSRLGEDAVLEIAARLPTPSAAFALALASPDLYSVVRPALFRAKFLAGFLARATAAPPQPSGFFLSTGGKARGYIPEDPARDNMFVRCPLHLLQRYNVVDLALFRAFLASLKGRRAFVAASCGRLLLCACAHSTGARYSVVDPAADMWVPLQPPPPLVGGDDASYRECAAFHCTAAMDDLTVAYLTRQRDGPLVANWFTSATGLWRSGATAARGRSLQPASAATRVGDTFYWLLLPGDAASRPTKTNPRAIMACSIDREGESSGFQSWMVAPPGGDASDGPGKAVLREADGLLLYCHTDKYRVCPEEGLIDDPALDVWTMEAVNGQPETVAANWRLRHLDGWDYNEACRNDVTAEFWTWLLCNNIHDSPSITTQIGRDAWRIQPVVDYSYHIFRYTS